MTFAIVPRSTDFLVHRAPIPHKIYMEGEFDKLHGEGHAGKERQDIVNQIYSNIQSKTPPLSFPTSSRKEDLTISH